MPRVLYNVRWPNGPPTIDQICEKYCFSPDELDGDYGVVEIDPQDHLYSILVDDTAIARVEHEWDAAGKRDKGLKGPFSNPMIEPFGPPEGRSLNSE